MLFVWYKIYVKLRSHHCDCFHTVVGNIEWGTKHFATTHSFNTRNFSGLISNERELFNSWMAFFIIFIYTFLRQKIACFSLNMKYIVLRQNIWCIFQSMLYIFTQDVICLTFHFCCGLLNIRQSISVLIRYFEMWMKYKIETEKNWRTAGNSIVLFSLLTLFVLSVWNHSKGISVLLYRFTERKWNLCYAGCPNVEERAK